MFTIADYDRAFGDQYIPIVGIEWMISAVLLEEFGDQPFLVQGPGPNERHCETMCKARYRAGQLLGTMQLKGLCDPGKECRVTLTADRALSVRITSP